MTTGDSHWRYLAEPYVLRDDQRGPDHDHATTELRIFVTPMDFVSTLVWQRERSPGEWEPVGMMRVVPLHMAQLQMALHEVYGDIICPTCRRPKYIDGECEQ